MKKVRLPLLYLVICFTIALFIHTTTSHGSFSDAVCLPLFIGDVALLLIISAVILNLLRQRSKISDALALTLLIVYGLVPGKFPIIHLGSTLLVIVSAVILDLARQRFKTSSNFLGLILLIVILLDHWKFHMVAMGGVGFGLYGDLFAGFIIPVGVAALCLVRSTVFIWKGRESLIHALIFIVAMFIILLVVENTLKPWAYRGFFTYEIS